MRNRTLFVALGASAVLAFGVAACGDDDDSGSGSGDSDAASAPAGDIAIDGSSTVQPFAEAAAELFNEENSEVNISVGAAGTGGGFEKFCAGETDISDASRPIDPKEEVPLCEKDGIEYTEIQVANDGIAIATNPAVEISCLTTDQLAELWTDDKITNYSELGDDADTGEPLPDVDVSLYGPGTDSGTFDYFTDVINGEEGVSRKEYQPSEDDNQLVQGVGGDDGALGYFGFSYYEQNADTLNLVSVDSGDGCVEPSWRPSSRASTRRCRGRCSCTRQREAERLPARRSVHAVRRRQRRRDRRGRADRPDGRDAVLGRQLGARRRSGQLVRVRDRPSKTE